MRDVRVFIRGGLLLVYDRSCSRVGEPSPFVVVRRDSSGYSVGTGSISGCYRDTDLLEDEIYAGAVGCSLSPVSLDVLPSIMRDSLGVSESQSSVVLSALAGSPSRVESLVKEILSLSSSERSEIFMVLLDAM